MELLTPSGGTIFWTTLTFLVLLLILYKIGWRPVLQMLNDRETKIRDSLQQAEKAQQEAEKTLKEQALIIETAKNKAQEILASSRKSAENTSEEIVHAAREEADHMLERAKKEIDQSRSKAVKEIRDLAVELSIAATQKLIGKSLGKDEHERVVQESINKLDKVN